MTALLERLRARSIRNVDEHIASLKAGTGPKLGRLRNPDGEEAAAHIEALTREIEGLRAALELVDEQLSGLATAMKARDFHNSGAAVDLLREKIRNALTPGMEDLNDGRE